MDYSYDKDSYNGCSDIPYFNNLDEISEKYCIDFEKIDYDKANIILQIFNSEYIMQSEEIEDGWLWNLIGLYNMCVTEQYEVAKKQFLHAIDLGTLAACQNLGMWYEVCENNFEGAVECYLQGIQYNDSECAFSLGVLYANDSMWELATYYFCKHMQIGLSKGWDKDYVSQRLCYIGDYINPEGMEEIITTIEQYEKDLKNTKPQFKLVITCNLPPSIPCDKDVNYDNKETSCISKCKINRKRKADDNDNQLSISCDIQSDSHSARAKKPLLEKY